MFPAAEKIVFFIHVNSKLVCFQHLTCHLFFFPDRRINGEEDPKITDNINWFVNGNGSLYFLAAYIFRGY